MRVLAPDVEVPGSARALRDACRSYYRSARGRTRCTIVIADERLVRARGALGRRGAEHADVVDHEHGVGCADDGEVAAEHGARARDAVIRGREQRPVLRADGVL